MMKKNLLALSVVAALSGLGLLGCGGGGGSDDEGSNDTVRDDGAVISQPNLVATFVDSAVAGLNYTCGNYTNVTNDAGQFKFNDGDKCIFKLGSLFLGETVLKQGQTLVTPYTIANNGNKDLAIRIAALLQTMDTDGNVSNGISLDKNQIDKLGAIELSSDEKFLLSMAEALKTAGINRQVVDLATAKAHLAETLASINGKSVAVTKILSDFQGLSDFKSLNVEEKLNEYKALLNGESTDEGKIDRQVLQAIIDVLEVTNDPIVTERVAFTSSALGSGYTSNLVKAIDVIIHSPAEAQAALKGGKGYTRDTAQLFGKYAEKLAQVGATLADIQDPDYQAIYGENGELVVNYEQVKALRASAIAMASALNVAASYQFGPDDFYVNQQEQITLAKILVTREYSFEQGSTITYQEGSDSYPAEFSTAEIEPEKLLQHSDFFRLNDDAKARLSKAKIQLIEALQLALAIDQAKIDDSLSDEEIKENKAQLQQYSDHMAGKLAVVEFEKRETHYVENNGIWEPKETGVKYKLNLLPFFDEMLDRNDVALNIEGECAKSVGLRDTELSKALATPMCLISGGEFRTLYASTEDPTYDYSAYSALYELGFVQNDSSYSTIYAQGVHYEWHLSIAPVSGSTFNKIFVSCQDLDGNEISCAEQL